MTKHVQPAGCPFFVKMRTPADLWRVQRLSRSTRIRRPDLCQPRKLRSPCTPAPPQRPDRAALVAWAGHLPLPRRGRADALSQARREPLLRPMLAIDQYALECRLPWPRQRPLPLAQVVLVPTDLAKGDQHWSRGTGVALAPSTSIEAEPPSEPSELDQAKAAAYEEAAQALATARKRHRARAALQLPRCHASSSRRPVRAEGPSARAQVCSSAAGKTAAAAVAAASASPPPSSGTVSTGDVDSRPASPHQAVPVTLGVASARGGRRAG